MAGSRPGSLIAGCWAAMLRHGYEGYKKSAERIIACRLELETGIRDIDELSVVGHPHLSVVAFESSGLNENVSIYPLGDLLSRKGWHLNILQFPPSIHVACTLPTMAGVKDLVADVREAVEALKNDPAAGKGSVASIYGTAASVPDRSIIGEVSFGFLDALTKI
jgi:sphinganine-1-phosphate aldolase